MNMFVDVGIRESDEIGIEKFSKFNKYEMFSIDSHSTALDTTKRPCPNQNK